MCVCARACVRVCVRRLHNCGRVQDLHWYLVVVQAFQANRVCQTTVTRSAATTPPPPRCSRAKGYTDNQRRRRMNSCGAVARVFAPPPPLCRSDKMLNCFTNRIRSCTDIFLALAKTTTSYTQPPSPQQQ